MLSAKNLSSLKQGRVLFEHLGFSLLPGSLCQLRGPNGSGKTTLLRILAGLEAPAEGEVEWAGEATNSSVDFHDAVLYIGHKNALKSELSVEKNVRFWADAYDTEMLTEAALRYFDLEHFREMECGRLSAGWQRRVALARLVAVPAKLWLLDEPFAHLDGEGTEKLYTLIAGRINQQGIVIMSGHETSKIQPTQTVHIPDFAA